LSLYVGDKYNNPVEEGTTIYLRTSGGIATTDVLTDSLGVGAAKLWTANPNPRLESDDPNAMVPHEIPNPNDPSTMLPVVVPDFDGDGAENNGIAYILATTHGRDQNGEDAVAFYVGRLIFSGPLAVFDVTADDYSLSIGQAATITVRVYDVNGNPLAAGSSLKVETSAGALSAEQLMATEKNYGYGSTTFQVQLVNNLDSQAESPATALVRFILESPNGSTSRGISIQLLNQ
jgi:hypothetical protein